MSVSMRAFVAYASGMRSMCSVRSIWRTWMMYCTFRMRSIVIIGIVILGVYRAFAVSKVEKLIIQGGQIVRA